jgi:nitrite reductase/ring-hydroxylating ferredoxin subunit
VSRGAVIFGESSGGNGAGEDGEDIEWHRRSGSGCGRPRADERTRWRRRVDSRLAVAPADDAAEDEDESPGSEDDRVTNEEENRLPPADEVDAGPAAALAEGGRLTVAVDGEEVVVIRHQGRLHALRNRCPHANGRLGDGALRCDPGPHGLVRIVCPLHQWAFDLETGATRRDPRLRAVLHRVRTVDDRIRVARRAASPETPRRPRRFGRPGGTNP